MSSVDGHEAQGSQTSDLIAVRRALPAMDFVALRDDTDAIVDQGL
jgi:hypothetical protein